MKLTSRLAALFLVVAGAALAATPPALDSLVEAERQFAATSVAKGMKEAFVSFLADSAVLFRPLPVDGKKLWVSRDSVPGVLDWAPSLAGIAASGDFGYTSGPWEFRSGNPADTSVGYGHFISVWRKQPDGAWRVVIDIGVEHERPARGVKSGDLELGPSPKSKGSGPIDVTALDRELSAETAARGIAKGYVARSAADLELHRDGFLPARGPKAIVAAFDSVRGALDFSPLGSGLSSSSDLGYTYGISRLVQKKATAPSDSGVYVHIWRREDGKKWKLAVAVENPL